MTLEYLFSTKPDHFIRKLQYNRPDCLSFKKGLATAKELDAIYVSLPANKLERLARYLIALFNVHLGNKMGVATINTNEHNSTICIKLSKNIELTALKHCLKSAGYLVDIDKPTRSINMVIKNEKMTFEYIFNFVQRLYSAINKKAVCAPLLFDQGMFSHKPTATTSANSVTLASKPTAATTPTDLVSSAPRAKL